MKMKLLVFILSMFLLSCVSKIEKTVLITDFHDSFIDSLVPTDKMVKDGYIAFNVEIKGHVNDSIEISLDDGNKRSWFYLTGEIDYRYFDEYSGCCPRYVYVNSYKATDGKLEIKYGLYK